MKTQPSPERTPWSAVICMMLTSFTLVASEFMPVSLLTPIAAELKMTAGEAGQAISISGFFAVFTALLSNVVFSRFDKRLVVLGYTAVLIVSGLAVTFAPNYWVFMFGRALIGISIGGYWSLATAIVARIAAPLDVPRALAMLQSGSALAAVVAAPLGSFLGGLVGWRGAFFIVVPIGIAVLVGQTIALPRVPGSQQGSLGRTFRLMTKRGFAIGMVAMILFFVGQFSLSTYLRPLLEDITHLYVNALSLVLLGIGLAGFAGTWLISPILRAHMAHVLIGFPAILGLVSLALIVFASNPLLATCLLLLWGLFTSPVPAAWTTWMTRTIPEHLEEGGAWFVALIQFAITAGAFSGGLLFDRVGWWSPSALTVLTMGLSALTAIAVTRAPN